MSIVKPSQHSVTLSANVELTGSKDSSTQGCQSMSATKASTSAEHCSVAVMDAIPLVMRFIRASIQADDDVDMISVQQIRVLACLILTPGSSLSDVARFLSVTKATASNMVARMVERGLVERQEDPAERRCVILNATDAGQSVYIKARAQAQTAVLSVLDKLTPEQNARIAEGLLLLREAFQ